MNECCCDNRFEIIAAYKRDLLDGTNIETSPEEMAVVDNILFRFWQMGWLKEKPQTNADRIRAMTDEELIEFAGYISACPPVDSCADREDYDAPVGSHCIKCWLDWLKEATDD